MATCDLCNTDMTTCGCGWREAPPTDDDWKETDDNWWREERRDEWPPPVQAPTMAVRELQDFSAAAAQMRARHQVRLREVSAWASAHGRSIDLDLAAVWVEVLEGRSTGSSLVLSRPGVNSTLYSGASNWCALNRTLLPEGAPAALWCVLSALAAGGHLDPSSDPLDALLEPTRCYGGLDADGHPRPPGVEAELDCRCYFPFDPDEPEGMVTRTVRYTREGTLDTYVRPGPREGQTDPADLHPLLLLECRLAQGAVLRIDHEEWTYVGLLEAGPGWPELRLYQHDPSARLGFPPMALDEAGQVWIPNPDRRYKRGYRWVEKSDRHHLWAVGG